MPPKRHVFDVQETTAAKWQRLCPNRAPPASLAISHVSYNSDVQDVVPKRGSKRGPPRSTSAATAYVIPPPGRADAPVVRHARRGSTAAAVAALAAFGSISLVEALLQDRYAKSASSTAATLAATWEFFHDQAFAVDDQVVPYLPITVRILVMVGALFKAAGYRSYPNYISAMKGRHIEVGFDWDQLLQHTYGWVTRSVLRGIGPARQSCAFHFDKVAKLHRTLDPLVTLGPCNPLVFTLLAVIFLLREIEASTARVSAWTFDEDAKEITWNLPGSKSDHKALGVKRTWPCICGHMVVPCPYHLAVSHMAWLSESSHSTDPDAPLFPTAKGRMPIKASVVATFEAIGTMVHQALWSDEGLRLFGGHSARVTGAQLFAALGIDVNKIRILARHSGETIMRYVQDAPLKSLRADLGLTPQGTMPVQFAAAGGGGDTVSQKRLHALTEALSRLESLVAQQNDEITSIREAAATEPSPLYVQHTVLDTAHRLRPGDDSRTICGIDIMTTIRAQPHARSHRRIDIKTYKPLANIDDLPGILICKNGLRKERREALAKELTDAALSGDEVEE